MSFVQAALSVSKDTPTNSTPLFLNSSCILITLGKSFLQSGHQLAQKSTTTYLPFKLLNLKVFPSAVFNLKSGAFVPGFNNAVAYLVSASGMPNCALTDVAHSIKRTAMLNFLNVIFI